MMFPKPQKPERGTAACKRHMEAVAGLSCVVCGFWPVHVHHCISGRFGQTKASDFDTIPLCFDHHQGAAGIHTNKRAWEAEHGPDYAFLEKVNAEIGR